MSNSPQDGAAGNISGKIHILSESVARRIAAGEVIDRPFSVVRELLDNALDANSTEIGLFIEEGGKSRIRVLDNGSGMSLKDLELCYQAHATSKITNLKDLETTQSLGFRGEALASIASVSKLIIISAEEGAHIAGRIVIEGGKLLESGPYKGRKGSIVEVRDLFFNLPARRRFLKSSSAESAMCRNAFIEKALPFPECSFRYHTGEELKLFLPESSLEERIFAAFSFGSERSLFHRLKGSGEGLFLDCIAAEPGFHRKDRKYIQIFINRRRLWEFSLIQAVEYAYSGFMPGGSYPYCFIFLNIDPLEIDFNIHPAKREARFKNIAEIRHKIQEVLGAFLKSYSIKSYQLAREGENSFDWTAEPSRNIADSPIPQPGKRTAGPPPIVADYSRHVSQSPERGYLGRSKLDRDFHYRERTEADGEITYYGQVFDSFLIAQQGNQLYLVDQHAAHERILFDKFRHRGSIQKLLIPLDFDMEDETELLRYQNALNELGVIVEKRGEKSWRITAVPENLRESTELLIQSLSELSVPPAEFEKELFADLACKAAIKTGDRLDAETAMGLLQKTFLLENARCPHGRPIWFRLSKEELNSFVGRS